MLFVSKKVVVIVSSPLLSLLHVYPLPFFHINLLINLKHIVQDGGEVPPSFRGVPEVMLTDISVLKSGSSHHGYIRLGNFI